MAVILAFKQSLTAYFIHIYEATNSIQNGTAIGLASKHAIIWRKIMSHKTYTYTKIILNSYLNGFPLSNHSMKEPIVTVASFLDASMCPLHLSLSFCMVQARLFPPSSPLSTFCACLKFLCSFPAVLLTLKPTTYIITMPTGWTL